MRIHHQNGVLLAILLIVTPHGATAFLLHQAVEPPPEIYASGATQTGKTYLITYPDPRQVDYMCRLGLGPPPLRGGSWWGCYRADMDAIIVPAKGSWEEHERQRIIAHEWAHAR